MFLTICGEAIYTRTHLFLPIILLKNPYKLSFFISMNSLQHQIKSIQEP